MGHKGVLISFALCIPILRLVEFLAVDAGSGLVILKDKSQFNKQLQSKILILSNENPQQRREKM